MSRARDLADSADKDIAGTLTADGLSVDGGTIKLDGNYPTGTANVGIGNNALSSLTTGTRNTAVGEDALSLTTTGVNNTAFGKNAVKKNVSGSYNTGIGDGALVDNTASNNTAVGYNALLANTTGTQNTAVGNIALDANTTGQYHTVIGSGAGSAITTAERNTCVGKDAGSGNTVGDANTYVGAFCASNTTGTKNSFYGDLAGYYVTTGDANTIIGRHTGNQDGIDIRTSSNNVIIADGDGNVVFCKVGVTRLPDAGADATSDGADAVLRTDGRLQRSTSSRRYKTDIEDAPFGLQDAMNLRPVTFKGIHDGDQVFAGFIAEEVDEAGLNCFVKYDAENQPESISYGNITSLCIKAIQELKAENDALKARVEALENA